MKRYKFRLLHSIDSIVDIDEIVIDDFEHPEGEWVKYEDILNECNCETQSLLRKTQGPIEYKSLDLDWICPAHGYKAVKPRVRSI